MATQVVARPDAVTQAQEIARNAALTNNFNQTETPEARGIVQNAAIKNGVAVSNAVPANEVASAPGNFDHTKIQGRFNQFNSGYWALTVPLLSARYVAEGLNKVLEPYTEIKFPEWHDKAWSIGVGLSMMAVTGFYTSRTYGDMKRQFAEPVGWEFNKDPTKVNIIDILKSKNTLVQDTVKNFSTRTILRFAVNLPFFAYLVPSPFKGMLNTKMQQQEKNAQEMKDAVAQLDPKLQKVFSKILPKLNDEEIFTKLSGPKNAVNLGVGANAMYLASDAISRKRTFFEDMQNFIDQKLNQSDKIGEMVTAQDLINLYSRQSHYNNDVVPLPKMNTPEWQNDIKLFSRMADLMNQTYGNTANAEQANFTMPKLVYLLGMRLVKSKDLERNLTYVEVANRYGVKAVEQIAKQVKNGGNIEAILSEWPVAKAKVEEEVAQAGAVASDLAGRTFANDGLKKAALSPPLSSHVENAAQKSGLGMGLAAGI